MITCFLLPFNSYRMGSGKEEAEKLAVSFQIQNLLGKYPYELSGGEKQRTAICRALVNQPDVIFADEPTGNLDSRSTEIVMDVFSMIHSKMHKTVIMVTHDISVAEYSERTLYIEDGKITEDRQYRFILKRRRRQESSSAFLYPILRICRSTKKEKIIYHVKIAQK